MNRIPEDDPRKTPQFQYQSPALRELNGLVGMGMKKEALKLARRLLKRETQTAEEFSETLDAILTLADKCKPWAPLVETAYARLSKRDQKTTRFWMLCFYISHHSYEAALRFVPQRFGGELPWVELAFAVEAALATGKMDLANKLARRVPRAIENADHPMMKSQLLLSLAECLARQGKWDAAIAIWEVAQFDPTFSQNAVINIVEIHAARALRTLQHGFELIKLFNQDFDPEAETIVPGNDKAIQNDAVKKFGRLKKIVERILPEERRKQLGIAK